MAYKRRIIVKLTKDDSTSTSDVKAPHVNDAMIEAAEDLIYALMTGHKRPEGVTGKTITDEQITWLFEEHCECRPVDVLRRSHSHDCDTLITELCRDAMMVHRDGGQRRYVARERCAYYYNEDVGARHVPNHQDAVKLPEHSKRKRKKKLRAADVGNSDSIGLHSMVEGNRGDHQT